MVKVLDIKLLRDLRRLWAQALAIAFVIAGGVATLIMAVGSYRSLDETRRTYYERHRFADVFATVRRAPKSVLIEIAMIPGVSAVEGKITKLALLDIPGFQPPVTAQIVSLPEQGEPVLNMLYLRTGRLPDPMRTDEAVVSESFAAIHSLTPGMTFHVNLNGRRRQLTVVGTALSPEFIYAIGPGDIMPDDSRFGIVWMGHKPLAAAYDLEGAFSFVSIKLLRGSSEREVTRRVDAILDQYGGRAAYTRKDQTSHAFLDHELDMLSNMSRTLPPIFLLVGAFLVNLTLSRLVALDREQIGLLKALGYANAAIVSHYLKLILIIVALGVAIGSLFGTWLGVYITRLFGLFFHFPFLVFGGNADVYSLAAGVSFVAAGIGASRAIIEILKLPPAIAMQPPAPLVFRQLLPRAISRLASQPAMVMLRNVLQHPLRSGLTLIGMSLATGILIVSLFTRDTMEELIDVTYFLADRYDATVAFSDRRSEATMREVARMPGVLVAEPYREVPVRVRHASVERRILITGRPTDADLSRIVDVNLRPITPPKDGLAISEMLAAILRVRVGDLVEIDLLDGRRDTLAVPVVALIEDYFGLRGMMELDALNRTLRDSPSISGVRVTIDPSERPALYEKIKSIPMVAALALQSASLANFRQSVALLVTTMGGIYTGLAAVIAFGIVYNGARISLSERSRELASLRVLGFTRGEVARMLLMELGVLTLLAQPPGWVAGYGLASIMRNNLAGELMRVRLVVDNSTYVLASAIVMTAALVSALTVIRRISNLDLIAVLKTRD